MTRFAGECKYHTLEQHPFTDRAKPFPIFAP